MYQLANQNDLELNEPKRLVSLQCEEDCKGVKKLKMSKIFIICWGKTAKWALTEQKVILFNEEKNTKQILKRTTLKDVGLFASYDHDDHLNKNYFTRNKEKGA